MTARSSSLHLAGTGFASPLSYAPATAGKSAASLIGDEPPMALDSEAEIATAPLHGVNLRWLAGTVLAGVGGMALVGASLLIALDGETNFASKAKLAILRNAGGADGQEFARPRNQGRQDRLECRCRRRKAGREAARYDPGR